MLQNRLNQPLPAAVVESARAMLQEHQFTHWRRTDRLFAGLFAFEWIAGIVLAFWRSPLSWNGSVSHINPHVWAAIFLGGAIAIGPILLAFFHPAQTITRHTIAVGQMLMSALLIHLGDGRIEMHFHIFGSLAFLSFYRDWRVLITATAVVVIDHVFRGMFMPMSVYGVLTAPLWRTAEHGGWVIFEDLFLIGSCIRSEREMRGIAENRALLKHSYEDVERKVQERTEELKNAQAELLKAARSAGMAEIATSVLHNVGNVLNSVNVSADVVAKHVKQSEVSSLEKLGAMIELNKRDLATFLTQDARGKLIPSFITELATCLSREQEAMLKELEELSKGIHHIKHVVAAQQSMAKKSSMTSEVKPAGLFDTALALQGDPIREDIVIRKRYQDLPPMWIDQHKVLQILINLISNARQAVATRSHGQRQISLFVERITTPEGDRLRYQVLDNGTGISPRNLTRIFNHGFTTKSDGHGFGLHSAANAAREMDGSLTAHSDGENKGALFTLELPIVASHEEIPCA